MPDKTDLDWEEYEAITQYIYGALGAQYNIKVKAYGRNCRVIGKSKVQHQIDVLTDQFDGERQLLTAIECKYWNKKVNKDIVMKLAETMLDCDIASGIIVCKTWFTRDTVIYAEHKGIKLVKLWEADENDTEFKKTMEIGVIDLDFGVFRSRAKVTSIEFGSKIITDEHELIRMHYITLHDAAGNTISFSEFLKAFSEEVQKRDELWKTTTITYPLTRTLYWRQPNYELAIEKIAITGFFEKIDLSSRKSFRLSDQVWMIMSDLFDQRRLTLSKSGLIWNLPKGS
jgi:hypothetical protein